MAKVWMKVSNDKYEFPEVIASSAPELARLCDVNVNTIYSTISHYRRGDIKSCVYVCVHLDDTAEEADAKRRHRKVLRSC